MPPRSDGRAATSQATLAAAPLVSPTSSPSTDATRRVHSKASSSRTSTISSSRDRARSKIGATKPGPTPVMWCSPCLPPEYTGEAAGSKPMIRMDGFRSFMYRDMPEKLPPVPRPMTMAARLPPSAS